MYKYLGIEENDRIQHKKNERENKKRMLETSKQRSTIGTKCQ